MRPSVAKSLPLLLVCVGLAACGLSDNPTSPEASPQFAKGGHKGGGGSGDPATLDEYWVYTGSDGVDRVHMVVSGADAIKKGVVHDFFFNGLSDDNAPFDQHYEWNDPGMVTPATGVLADGRAHVDLVFNGERDRDGGFYRDFPATSVGSSGADPFVFHVTGYRGSSRVGGWEPRGVIVDGVTLGVEESGSFFGAGHTDGPVGSVRSYATFKGAEGTGTTWISSLGLSEVRCTASGGGRGKKRNTSPSGVTVTGTVTLSMMTLPQEDNGQWWWEGHFADANGALSTRFSGMQPPGTFTVTAAMPTGWTGGSELEFVVDFVRPTGGSYLDENTGDYVPDPTREDYVYDPTMNEVPTTLGVLGSPWPGAGLSQSVGDGRFPVAHSGFVSVSCGG